MTETKQGNPWGSWEERVEIFKKAREFSPPVTTIRDWQRNLIFSFMEELSKNVLDENVSLDSIIDEIIEAIQISYGFKRVRVYHAYKFDENNMMLHLLKTSRGHDPIEVNLKLNVDRRTDAAVDTLFTKKPFIVDDVRDLNFKYKEELKISGAYAAIPLFVEGTPYGLICSDAKPDEKPDDSILDKTHFIHKEHFDIFAHTIIAAIENRNMFEQKRQSAKQFELVKEFHTLIHDETDDNSFYLSYLKFCIQEVNADGGHLKLFDDKEGELKRVARWGEYTSPEEVKSKPRDIGFSNLVYRNRTALLINDLTDDLFMKKTMEFYKREGFVRHMQNLKKRKSALIVPIIDPTGEARGVIDLHSKKENHFTEISKRNLQAIGSKFTYFLDSITRFKTQKEHLKQKEELLKEQKELLDVREIYQNMLGEVLERPHDLPSVLQIIVTTCEKVVKTSIIDNSAIIVSLTIKSPYFRILATVEGYFLSRVPPDSDSTIKAKGIEASALEYGRIEREKNEIAFPISIEGKSEGLLYIGTNRELTLNINEEQLLEIIAKTTGVLVTLARDFEKKIKQSSTLFDITQQSKKKQNFSNWFNPVMDKVMDIIGGKNRYFYLAMIEKSKGKEIIRIKAASSAFRDLLLGKELQMDDSLSGAVINDRVRKYIPDVQENDAKDQKDPTRISNYIQDPKIKSVVGIPLLITEEGEEKAIGVLLIDSKKRNDFKDLDWEFLETIANYFATIIYNQQLSDERSQMQAELARKDTAAEVNIIFNNSFHDIKDPLQDIKCAFNILRLSGDENEKRDTLKHAEELSNQLLSITDMYSNNFARTAGEQKTIEVRKLIDDSLDTIAETTGLSIAVQREYETFDSKIYCNPVSIQMAFRAIINNANKYSRKLDEKNRYLKISANINADDTVSITFESSTYKAIPEDKLQEIFDLSKRATTEESGKGLGLPLAKLSVNLHRGKITAKNLEPKNDVKIVQFTVTLPKGFGILDGDAK